jgi:hypothetical protein
MTGTWLRTTRMTLVGLTGLTVLLGSPLLAQADQGKWWTPRQGGRRIEERGRVRDEGWRGGPWRGARVRRDVVVIRDGRRGGYFRARRIYYEPYFARRTVYVRPVRYFIAADVRIGGVGIHARIIRPHYVYGCNFCDARFDRYDDYLNHVERCDHRPSGYRIRAEDRGYDDEDWNGPYRTDDGGSGYDRSYRDDRDDRDDPGYRDNRDRDRGGDLDRSRDNDQDNSYPDDPDQDN